MPFAHVPPLSRFRPVQSMSPEEAAAAYGEGDSDISLYMDVRAPACLRAVILLAFSHMRPPARCAENRSPARQRHTLGKARHGCCLPAAAAAASLALPQVTRIMQDGMGGFVLKDQGGAKLHVGEGFLSALLSARIRQASAGQRPAVKARLGPLPCWQQGMRRQRCSAAAATEEAPARCTPLPGRRWSERGRRASQRRPSACKAWIAGGLRAWPRLVTAQHQRVWGQVNRLLLLQQQPSWQSPC